MLENHCPAPEPWWRLLFLSSVGAGPDPKGPFLLKEGKQRGKASA